MCVLVVFCKCFLVQLWILPRNFARAMPQRAAEVELLLPSSYVLSSREDCRDFKDKADSPSSVLHYILELTFPLKS